MKRKPRHSVPHYTYRQSTKSEERIIYRRVGIAILAVAVFLAVLWFWGTSFINLLGFLSKPEEPTSAPPTFDLPITKPALKPLPEATNSEKITVEGTTSASQEVTLESSTGTIKTIAETDGSFSFEGVTLKKGLNLIKVFVLDSTGNKLEESFVITFDNTKPLLEITQPKDGQTFPSSTKSIKVVGKTEEKAIVFINNIQAIVNPQGQFSFNYPAQEGTVKLEIKATDLAGNTEKTTLTVIVSKED